MSALDDYPVLDWRGQPVDRSRRRPLPHDQHAAMCDEIDRLRAEVEQLRADHDDWRNIAGMAEREVDRLRAELIEIAPARRPLHIVCGTCGAPWTDRHRCVSHEQFRQELEGRWTPPERPGEQIHHIIRGGL